LDGRGGSEGVFNHVKEDRMKNDGSNIGCEGSIGVEGRAEIFTMMLEEMESDLRRQSHEVANRFRRKAIRHLFLEAYRAGSPAILRLVECHKAWQ
jgi:hypothetical protein